MAKTGMLSILAIAISLIILSACGSLTVQPTLEFNPQTATPELIPPTPMPTYTPTPAPLGSPENPIVIGLIIQENVAGQAEALQSVLMQLSEGLSLSFTNMIFTNYVDLELALQRGEVDMAWLTAPEYLLASQKRPGQCLAGHQPPGGHLHWCSVPGTQGCRFSDILQSCNQYIRGNTSPGTDSIIRFTSLSDRGRFLVGLLAATGLSFSK